jgi:Ni/Co efflux regulator RcnB
MKKLLTAAVALSVLLGAGAASAQPYGHGRDDRKAERQYERQVDRAERKYDKQVRKAERRYRTAAYRPPQGYRHHQWRTGERLPVAYRATPYRIDYRTYRLPPPPRGYYYTRVDNDVVLTAAASGLIASVIVDLFQ